MKKALGELGDFIPWERVLHVGRAIFQEYSSKEPTQLGRVLFEPRRFVPTRPVQAHGSQMPPGVVTPPSVPPTDQEPR